MRNTYDRFQKSDIAYNNFRMRSCILLAIIFFIATGISIVYSYYLKKFEISLFASDSGMEPIIMENENVIGTQRFKLEYGDIVFIYDAYMNESEFIRVIIAFEGDTVQYIPNENRLVVRKKGSSTLVNVAYDFRGSFNHAGNSVTLQENEVFVLGENYNDCLDSTDGASGGFRRVYIQNVRYKILGKKSNLYYKFH